MWRKKEREEDFLAFDHNTYSATILRWNSRKWLAVKKPTYGKSTVDSSHCAKRSKSEQEGTAIFFTPILEEKELKNLGTNNKQNACSNILHNQIPHQLYMVWKKQSCDISTLQQNKDLLLKNDLIQEVKVEGESKSNFELDLCAFPNLKDKFVGTEVKLSLSKDAPTMFAPLFARETTINGVCFEYINLECTFAIRYNKVGGEIKNEASVLGEGASPHTHAAYKIVLGQPFILCYQTEERGKALDLYPFKICDPFTELSRITSVTNSGTTLLPSLKPGNVLDSAGVSMVKALKSQAALLID